jgi:hypothetical protein
LRERHDRMQRGDEQAGGYEDESHRTYERSRRSPHLN